LVPSINRLNFGCLDACTIRFDFCYYLPTQARPPLHLIPQTRVLKYTIETWRTCGYQEMVPSNICSDRRRCSCIKSRSNDQSSWGYIQLAKESWSTRPCDCSVEVIVRCPGKRNITTYHKVPKYIAIEPQKKQPSKFNTLVTSLRLLSIISIQQCSIL